MLVIEQYRSPGAISLENGVGIINQHLFSLMELFGGIKMASPWVGVTVNLINLAKSFAGISYRIFKMMIRFTTEKHNVLVRRIYEGFIQWSNHRGLIHRSDGKVQYMTTNGTKEWSHHGSVVFYCHCEDKTIIGLKCLHPHGL